MLIYLAWFFVIAPIAVLVLAAIREMFEEFSIPELLLMGSFLAVVFGFF